LFTSKVSKLIHRNNTIEVNLMECANKEDFVFENVKAVEGLETESAAGKLAGQLAEKATRMILRRR
jgi:hypothetical protein